MKRYSVITLFFIIITVPLTAEINQIYSGYSLGYSKTDTLTLGNSDRKNYPENTIWQHYLILSALMFKKIEPYAWVNYSMARETSNRALDVDSLGDANIGTKYWFKPEVRDALFSFAPLIEFKFPIADYSNTLHTSIGDGQTDIKSGIHLKYAYSFFIWQEFQLKAGYRFRIGDPADRIELLLDYQFIPVKYILLGIFTSYSNSLTNLNLGDPGSNLINTDINQFSFGMKAGAIIKSLYLEISYAKTLWSTNSVIYDSFGFHTGYLLKFN